MTISPRWAVFSLLISATVAQVISDLDTEQADRRSASASAQNGNGKREACFSVVEDGVESVGGDVVVGVDVGNIIS